jgi:hypothetical protein
MHIRFGPDFTDMGFFSGSSTRVTSYGGSILHERRSIGLSVVSKELDLRFRCGACGNLTRFDVVERRRTRSYYHFSIGGNLNIEESEDLDKEIESVTCRWCQATGRPEDFRFEEAEGAGGDDATDN